MRPNTLILLEAATEHTTGARTKTEPIFAKLLSNLHAEPPNKSNQLPDRQRRKNLPAGLGDGRGEEGEVVGMESDER